ncbi:MAG: tRNA (adenosine(37)-N6)-threonylcarbamoyltransferase complex dimerization subunit type 1 TsaB [Candidatus Kapaibacteriota bacterium]
MQLQTPLILSIDTSADSCNVLISSKNNLLLSYSIKIKRLHDKLLAELTNRALKDLNISISNIAAVAISSGPGSFTGLRIGAAFAKALTIDNSPKLISLPTLYAFAVEYETLAKKLNSKSITAIISANSGMIYKQIFNLNSEPQSQIEFINKDSLQLTNDTFLCGNFTNLNENFPTNPFNKLTPESIAESAYRLFLNDKFINSIDFEPLYIQDFVPR